MLEIFILELTFMKKFYSNFHMVSITIEIFVIISRYLLYTRPDKV